MGHFTTARTRFQEKHNVWDVKYFVQYKLTEDCQGGIEGWEKSGWNPPEPDRPLLLRTLHDMIFQSKGQQNFIKFQNQLNLIGLLVFVIFSDIEWHDISMRTS